MLAEERRFRIREVLAVQRTVSASDLRDMLGVTAATIRRDLAALEEEGVLLRSHGGAVSRTSSTNFQPSYEALAKTNPEAKQAIAREAEKLILDGDTLFLEGSTTVFELVRRLQHHQRVTAVTNSPLIVCQLQRCAGIRVMCIGGELQKDVFYLSGWWAQRALAEIRVDKAILGVSALDPVYGISTASQAEAQIKQTLLKIAKVRIGLVDHSKFGKQSFAHVGAASSLNVVVTDSGTNPTQLDQLREMGVQVIVAEN